MSKPTERNDSDARRKGALGKKSTATGIAVIVLVGIYSFAAPRLNSQYGWDLPAITTDADGNVRVADAPPSNARQSGATSVEAERKSNRSQRPTSDRDRPTESKPASENAEPPQATAADPAASGNASPADAVGAESEDEELLYGVLREVEHDRYMSPAGLLYAPGSAEGHRLEHLRRHTKNDPSRAGPHGVFDGDMEGALKTIDRAYERAKKGQRTTTKKDEGRTIYTVDMGSRVGYVGGREGNRRRKPMARRVRLVLEGNRVITAYPL